MSDPVFRPIAVEAAGQEHPSTDTLDSLDYPYYREILMDQYEAGELEEGEDYALFTREGAKTPDVIFKNSVEVTSPLTGKVIIRKNPDGTHSRFICDACVKYVNDKGQTHALDPVFFWGAGIYDYKSLATPEGTKAYLNRSAMAGFIRHLPIEDKRNWKDITGLNFPFLFLRDK